MTAVMQPGLIFLVIFWSYFVVHSALPIIQFNLALTLSFGEDIFLRHKKDYFELKGT